MYNTNFICQEQIKVKEKKSRILLLRMSLYSYCIKFSLYVKPLILDSTHLKYVKQMKHRDNQCNIEYFMEVKCKARID